MSFKLKTTDGIYKIEDDLTGTGRYAIKTGLYITSDYGDGRVDIEHYDKDFDAWTPVCDAVMEVERS